jgi:hypothetical protein
MTTMKNEGKMESVLNLFEPSEPSPLESSAWLW